VGVYDLSNGIGIGIYMFDADVIETVQSKYESFLPYLNERTRRVWAAMEATALGYGGIRAVAEATGLSRNTITTGIRELHADQGKPLGAASPQRIRNPGAGRKRIETQDQTLLDDLESLVEPTTRGDPESPLRWTCKSVNKLAAQLQQMGHQVCPKTVYK
jgi:hypothetical protein